MARRTVGPAAKCCRLTDPTRHGRGFRADQQKLLVGQGVTVFEEKMSNRRFNPVAVLFIVNSLLDLSVDTFLPCFLVL